MSGIPHTVSSKTSAHASAWAPVSTPRFRTCTHISKERGSIYRDRRAPTLSEHLAPSRLDRPLSSLNCRALVGGLFFRHHLCVTPSATLARFTIESSRYICSLARDWHLSVPRIHAVLKLPAFKSFGGSPIQRSKQPRPPERTGIEQR